MSDIQLPPSLQSAKVDTYTRTEGAETVHVQTVVAGNPFPQVVSTITANGQSVTVSNQNDAASALVTIDGTYAGLNLTFEISLNGTIWYPVIGVRMDTNAASTTTGVLTSNSSVAFSCFIGAATYFRARATAFTSGTANIDIAPTPYAITQNMTVGQPTAANLQATATLAAGASLAGDVGVGVRANATNAASQAKVLSAATTNATVVKGSAGRVYGLILSNTTASFKFFKLFNKATAPVPGTDTPVYTIAIPPNSCVDTSLPMGVGHSLGIGYTITNLAADLDATAVAANDVIGSVIFA